MGTYSHKLINRPFALQADGLAPAGEHQKAVGVRHA